MSDKMKTSISLPAEDEQQWRQHRTQISNQLPAYLREFHREKARRIGLRQFSNCEQGLVRFNVYWDQETYNQLHAVAHALCMSVSHLLWQILMFVVAGGKVATFFSNYVFQPKNWSARELSYSEKLTFKSRPRGKKTKHTPNTWDKTPLRFTA